MADEIGLAAVGVAPAVDEVRRVCPWAKSVVAAAVSYLPPERAAPDDAACGRVARVARSVDYHDVLRDKLARVAEALKSAHPQARAEICVDTCPIPERKLAVLAGIAWRGKSGNVFVEGCGSYAALGEIVADIELPRSEPMLVDLCADCDRCIRACPTGALTAPYVVDKNRCLSALTQMSGAIPRELRKAMGDRIYGCDVCQEVCPRNVGVEPASSEFAQEVFPGACPELIPLIRLSAREFREKIRDSSIGWIRRTRIRRNAAIAAGNLECDDAVPGLVEMLADENSTLRAAAAWALGEIRTAEAAAALREALRGETDQGVADEVRAALKGS